MNDEELAHAWESFATALADVPAQREHRRQIANLRRGTSLADQGIGLSQQQAARYQSSALYAERYQSLAPYAERYQPRGIRNGIFGLGIMI